METYEQKYKEALEKAKNMINDLRKGEDILAVSELETMFPELVESEDEKVRKAIIELLNTIIKGKKVYSIADTTRSEMIAWLENIPYTIDHEKREGFRLGYKAGLEKQGEQKHVDKVVPKFHKGDWIVWQDKCYKVNYNGCGYELIDQNGLSTSLEYGTVDKSAHLWTIKDAKDGDVLFQDLMDGKTFIYNGINPDMAILYSFIICNDGKDVLPYHIGKPNTGIGNIEENKNIINPATKEQRDTLERAITNAGYRWDREKLKLEKI